MLCTGSKIMPFILLDFLFVGDYLKKRDCCSHTMDLKKVYKLSYQSLELVHDVND